MTYLILSAVFLIVASTVAVVAGVVNSPDPRRNRIRRWSNPVAVTGVALIVLTAVFDNIMIAIGFMTYSDAHTTGLAFGLAPLEDFSYPLAALIILPALWALTAPRNRNHGHD